MNKIEELNNELISIDIERNEIQIGLMKKLNNNKHELGDILDKYEIVSDVFEMYNNSNLKHFEMVKKYEELKIELLGLIEELSSYAKL